MKNPMAVRDMGVEWRPFLVDFQTQEGTFSFHLYAVDMAHALSLLDELKATAIVKGELFGTFLPDELDDDL